MRPVCLGLLPVVSALWPRPAWESLLSAAPPYLPCSSPELTAPDKFSCAANTQEIPSCCFILTSSLLPIIYPSAACPSQWANVQILELDHLHSKRVPPLRTCMTLGKLSRLCKFRDGLLEMRETAPASGAPTGDHTQP